VILGDVTMMSFAITSVQFVVPRGVHRPISAADGSRKSSSAETGGLGDAAKKKRSKNDTG